MTYEHKFEKSSMLFSCSYDDTNQELTVTFTNGRVYTYEEVPYNTYMDLIGAKSAGAHFNMIKKGLKIK